MKIKTAELIGKPLDFAVTTLEWGHRYSRLQDLLEIAMRQAYSTDPAQGWPIIVSKKIWLRGPHDAERADGTVVLHINYWTAHIHHQYVQTHSDPLIAAMRCYVMSEEGDYVDIPKELANLTST